MGSQTAAVKTQIAPGRKEVGWEVGWLPIAQANATPNPVIGITINNDADFLVTGAWLMQAGQAGAPITLPSQVVGQFRDSGTGNIFSRQPGSPQGFVRMPYVPGSPAANGRFVSNKNGWRAPYVMRRASSVFFEMASQGYVFLGDLYLVLEGFRVYPGQDEPVPEDITGYAEPFCWNGTINVPGGLGAGVQKIGTIGMKGLDKNKYLLTRAAVVASGTVTAVGAALLQPEDVVLLNVYDTYQQNKLWARLTAPGNAVVPGQFMPAKVLTGGGTGEEWPWPRYVNGQDTIFVDIFTDPSAWVGGAPGTIEIQLNGLRAYA